MVTEFDVRPYQQGDEEDIIQLLTLVFKDWRPENLSCAPLDHWRWKYLDNPGGGNAITLAISSGKLIGVQHCFMKLIKIGDEDIICRYSGDQCVHPDFRRMGVATKLEDSNREMSGICGDQYAYYVTSNPYMIKSYERRRPRFPHDVLNLVRIQDIDKQLQAMPMKNPGFMKLGYLTMKSINRIKNIFNIHLSHKRDFLIREIKEFDERVNPFWEEVSRHYNYITVRNKDYLNWRYSDPRAGNNIILQAERDDQILGFCVLAIKRQLENYPIGYFLDLLTLPDSLNVAEALIEDAVDYLTNNGVNIICCQTIDNHPHESLLTRQGFVNSMINLQLFYRPYGDDGIKSLKSAPANRIHFTFGDIDTLPTELPAAR